MSGIRKILCVLFVSIVLSSCQGLEKRTTLVAIDSDMPTPQVKKDIDQDGCIIPPSTFAYLVEGRGEFIYPENITPPFPWEMETPLLPLPDNMRFGSNWLLAAFPQKNGQYDLWVLRGWSDDVVRSIKFLEIQIYNTGTGKWRTISTEVYATQGLVGELFMTNDGSIWAHHYWGEYVYYFEPPFLIAIHNSVDVSPPSGIPILSKFNEETARFEPEYGTLDIPASKTEYQWNKVLLDGKGFFWVISQQDGIYSYDSEKQLVERHIDLPEMLVRSAVVANETIFFSDGFWSVYRFDTETDELNQIGGSPLQFEDPYDVYFNSILADSQNRLWMGNIGWVENFEEPGFPWYQLVQPSIFVTNRGFGKPGPENSDPFNYWDTPWIMRESIDGRLWYKSANGLIWLDPEQEKWCWFTTYRSNVVEDTEGNLWIIADDEIFQLEMTE